jgi:phosphonate transport system substrate-binding protein
MDEYNLPKYDPPTPPRHSAFSSRPWFFYTGIVAAIGIAFCIWVYSFLQLTNGNNVHSRYTPQHSILLDDKDNASQCNDLAAVASPIFRIAVAPVISPKKTLSVYQDLIFYLGDALDRKAALIQRKNYTEINDLVRYKLCDIAFVCTNAFIRGKRELFMELLVIPEIKGKTTYRSFFLVPGDSEAKSLLELRGKRFASCDMQSFTGYCYAMNYLKKHGENSDGFFSKLITTGGHDLSVEAVASGFVDGAAVDSLIYEAMLETRYGIQNKVKIIHKSPDFPMPPVVIHPQTDRIWKQRILDVFLTMHQTSKGKQALSVLGIDKFVLCNPDNYDSIKKIAEELDAH